MNEYVMCLDLEMLCNKSGMINKKGGIIEIGACIYHNGEVVDEFETTIRPLNKSPITPFAEKLLGITQKQLDSSPCFDDAMDLFERWASKHEQHITKWVAWGDMDYIKLHESYELVGRKLPKVLTTVFYDAQIGFELNNYIFERIGLNDAIYEAGLTHNLTTHRALDDAKKITLIFEHCI